jgi:hypothetical protein
VERANAEILKGLKTRTYDGLKKHGKKWIDELPCALWGQPDLTQSSHGRDVFLHGVWGRGRPSPGSHHGLYTCQDI